MPNAYELWLWNMQEEASNELKGRECCIFSFTAVSIIVEGKGYIMILEGNEP